MSFALALHGGAGTITRSAMSPEKEIAYLDALATALETGRAILHNGGTALDAVCATVASMEDCPLFNAGRGAVFTHSGGHELDAAVMTGHNRMAGAVAAASGVRNPILLARAIMEQSDHVLLSGKGAEEFGRLRGLAFEPDDYFCDEFRWAQYQQAITEDKVMLDHSSDREKKFGTVGAVALDVHGNLAAATSTGGMTNKRWGRIGDSPLIGSGTWADNRTCAISCTGHGEFFIRAVVAHDIACLMEYKGLTLQEACAIVVHGKLVDQGGEGGLIAIGANGDIAMPFNSEGMYRAFVSADNEAHLAIYRDDSKS